MMNDFLTKAYRKFLRVLPVKPAVYLIYFRGYHKKLNLRDPKHFGEKIQWLKLYGNLDKVTKYVDKYEVRDYIERKIGNEYLNDLYGIYNNVEDINFEKLPKQFVLKCTNGSGTVMICKDKEKFDINNAKKIMKKWLKDNYYKEKKEPQYRDIKNKIIIEKYLEDNTGSLMDYKFYCFDGEPLWYGVFYDRYTDKSIDFYDIKGNKLDVITCNIKNSTKILPQNETIKRMIELSKKLSEPFQFVRVDFYAIEDKIIFGELTFTDGAGSDPFHPEKFDIEIASHIKTSNVVANENLL